MYGKLHPCVVSRCFFIPRRRARGKGTASVHERQWAFHCGVNLCHRYRTDVGKVCRLCLLPRRRSTPSTELSRELDTPSSVVRLVEVPPAKLARLLETPPMRRALVPCCFPRPSTIELVRFRMMRKGLFCAEQCQILLTNSHPETLEKLPLQLPPQRYASVSQTTNQHSPRNQPSQR